VRVQSRKTIGHHKDRACEIRGKRGGVVIAIEDGAEEIGLEVGECFERGGGMAGHALVDEEEEGVGDGLVVLAGRAETGGVALEGLDEAGERVEDRPVAEVEPG
jgi:hypothetical protein